MFEKPAILGFACDEGVRRNHGRVGAVDGPEAIRASLTRISGWSGTPFADAGTIRCDDGDLESAQTRLAEAVALLLSRGASPVVLGGGHEVAWGNFLGIARHLAGRRLGIVNLDAHFDLRDPAGGANSGTPFRQIAGWCEARGQAFNYLVLGINPAMNAAPLFEFATRQGVEYVVDTCVHSANLDALTDRLNAFVSAVDAVYLSVCLDAFPASVAPGVSAPGVPGVCPRTAIALLQRLLHLCRRAGTPVLSFDIAEMNPSFDRDAMTARLAARLVHSVLAAASDPAR